MIHGSKQKWWSISSPDPYPEIGSQKPLGRVILEIIALSGRATTLRDESNHIFSACFHKDRRSASMWAGGVKRMFCSDFSSRGIQLVHHETPDLQEIARAVESWLIDELTLQEIKQRFPNLLVSEMAFEIEAGRGVEACWNALLSLADRGPTVSDWLAPGFPALVHAAASRPLLRQLVPVVSIGCYLSFSRTIGYPFARASACAIWAGDDRYCVVGPDQKVFGEGTVQEVLDILEGSLPPDIGPAIYGTADDLIA